jgi:hypothetical protein
MRLGPRMELEVRQPSNKAYALEAVRKRMSRPPEKAVEVLGVAGVTRRALRKLNNGCYRVVSSVRQHGRLANLCNQRLERVLSGCL